MAKMESTPTGRLLSVSVATPLPLRFEVPRLVLPLKKLTEPVGVPDWLVTVAVKVTATPGVVLALEAVSAVVVCIKRLPCPGFVPALEPPQAMSVGTRHDRAQQISLYGLMKTATSVG